MDQSKKTMRHFYCRDVLWETFEQMANDFDCSIDYLINEAMRTYARTKNYPASAVPSSSQQISQHVVQQAVAAAAAVRPPSIPPAAAAAAPRPAHALSAGPIPP